MAFVRRTTAAPQHVCTEQCWCTSIHWLRHTAVVLAKRWLAQRGRWLSHLLVSFWYLLIPYSIFSGAYLQQRQL